MTEHTSHLPGSSELPGRLPRRSLKPGWTWVKFGDVVRLNTDRCADPEAEGIERYVGIEHIEPEDLHIRSWGLVEEGTTFTNYFKPGQVLFVKRRAYQRKVALAEFEGVCSGDIYVLEPKDNHLLPELLPFICQTDAFFAHAVNTSAGSLSPRTNWKQLAQYEFALPPLADQRRIALLLQKIDRHSNTLLEVTESLEKLRLSLLQDFWEKTSAQMELASVASHDPQNGLYVPSQKYGRGVPIIRIDSFYDGEMLKDTEWKCVDIDESLKTTFGVCPGDIIINRVNSKEFVGKAVVVPTWAEGYVYESNMMRVQIDRGKAVAEFVAAFINHPLVQQQVASRRKDAINQSSINQQDVLSLKVPFASMSTQRAFMEELESMQRAKREVEYRQSNTSVIRRKLLTDVSARS